MTAGRVAWWIATPIAALAALAFSAGPAFASTGLSTASAPQTVTTVHGDQTTSVTSSTRAATPLAGNPCSTGELTVTIYQLGNELYSWEASTYYCWNGVIVTYHSTTDYWHVTSLGYLDGSNYQDSYVLFHCYVAEGGTAGCSGNDEQSYGSFGSNSGEGGAGNTVDINQWENYHGQYFNSWSQAGY
jgi:hypothetical protein